MAREKITPKKIGEPRADDDGGPLHAWASARVAARAEVPDLARKAREIEIIAKRVMRDGERAPRAYVDFVDQWHTDLLRVAAERRNVQRDNARWIALDAAIERELVAKFGKDKDGKPDLLRFPEGKDGASLLGRLLDEACYATNEARFERVAVPAIHEAVELLAREYAPKGGRPKGTRAKNDVEKPSRSRGARGMPLLVGVIEALAAGASGAELTVRALEIATLAAPALRRA